VWDFVAGWRQEDAAVEDCLFCKIVAGEIPGDVVHVTERTVAFRDVNPQAPLHVLVVPREHYANAAELAAGDPAVSAELLTTAAAVATAEGHDDYRLVFNTGPGVGQTVFHAHLHLLAGRPMTWPPG
jgi:histidine triad (HIT) family protein